MKSPHIPPRPSDKTHDKAWLETQKADWPEGKPKNLFWKEELDDMTWEDTKDKECVWPVDDEIKEMEIKDPKALRGLARQGGADFRDWKFRRVRLSQAWGALIYTHYFFLVHRCNPNRMLNS